VHAEFACSRAGYASILLGFGLGGFVDGILAHQILGWHHMLSGWISTGTERGVRTNMVGDGFFHLACLLVVLVGIYLLRSSQEQPTPRRFTGLMLMGWGLFNVIEGVVDHQILGIHHVHPGRDEVWFDLGFLALGAILFTMGVLLARRGEIRLEASRP
jgi:uncharacterized membrane protein